MTNGQAIPHIPLEKGGVVMKPKPRVPSLDEFPEDVQNVVYEILATATLRAIKNGELVLSEEEIAAARTELEEEV